MLKKIVVAFISVAFLLCTSSTAIASNKAVFQINNKNYIANGHTNLSDSAPFFRDNRVYVPIRFIAYACGLTDENIFFDEATQSVDLCIPEENSMVVFYVAEKLYYKNGQKIAIDVAPIIVNERIYLPVRYVSEALGYQVSYDDSSQSVLIYVLGETPPTPMDDLNKTVTQYGYIKNVYKDSSGNVFLDVDLIEYYMGDKATKESEKDGHGIAANDYYIRNRDSSITKIHLPGSTIINVSLDIYGQPINLDSFITDFKKYMYSPYEIKMVNGQVTQLTRIYTP